MSAFSYANITYSFLPIFFIITTWK